MSSRIVPKPKNAKFAANKLRRAIMAVVRTTAAAKAPNFFFKEMESHQERMLSLAGFIEWISMMHTPCFLQCIIKMENRVIYFKRR